jgi:hypothetical protein
MANASQPDCVCDRKRIASNSTKEEEAIHTEKGTPRPPVVAPRAAGCENASPLAAGVPHA